MIDNVHSQIGQILGAGPPLKPERTNRQRQADFDATLQVNFGDLIKEAKNAEAADAEAVKEARELVNTGRLTTIQNIRAAAAEILSTGI
jgi:hypothetical protein